MGGRTLPGSVHLSNLRDRDGRLAALVDAPLLGLGDALPSWRSRRRLVSNSANTPSMSTVRAAPLASKSVDEVEHVTGGATQAVQLDHDQLIHGVEEVALSSLMLKKRC